MSAAALSASPALRIERLLQGVAPAVKDFQNRVGQVSGALKSLVTGVRRAAGQADGLAPAARQAQTALSRMKNGATASARTVQALGRGATTATAGVKRITAPAKRGRAGLAGLALGASGLLTMVVGMSTIGGTLGTALTAFGAAAVVGSIVMTAMNTVTKGNPLGLALAVLVPVLAYLLELALSSETGQRIMKQVFARVQETFQSVVTFLTPLMKLVGRAVGTYFTGYLTLITTVLNVVGPGVRKGFAAARSAVNGALAPLRSIASRALGGVRTAVDGVRRWFTGTLPRSYTRVRDAVANSLGGIGGFVGTGLQTVLGVIKGPLNGLIAFANWIIDGLNDLGGEFFGKKFGVHLDKIPMLAEGGVVDPSGSGGPASHVRPLSSLDRLRPAEASAAGARRPADPSRLHTYVAPDGHSPLAVAADLLFLHRTACAA
ncbi:tape-measure protein [Streptomyces sp. NPDC126497]|uniref:tape-measure protein n=1 Tax=Streptomyces sp. NPDC126497 TaxID=3155313 RepID=UPI00331FBC43